LNFCTAVLLQSLASGWAWFFLRLIEGVFIC